MSQQANLDLVRRAYESFNRWASRPELEPFRDPEVEDLLHPQVAFHTYASSPEAGVYRGREAVLDYNQRLFEQFASVHIELVELLPAGDQVVVVSRQHAVPKAGDAPLVVQVVEVWTIRDGLLAERHTFSTRTEALRAAGVSE